LAAPRTRSARLATSTLTVILCNTSPVTTHRNKHVSECRVPRTRIAHEVNGGEISGRRSALRRKVSAARERVTLATTEMRPNSTAIGTGEGPANRAAQPKRLEKRRVDEPSLPAESAPESAIGTEGVFLPLKHKCAIQFSSLSDLP
jgi:hypothetical protein